MRLVLLRKASSLLLALWWCMAVPVRSSDINTILESSSGYRSRWCGDVDTDSTLTLTCPPHTWYHVQQKITSEDSVNNCSSSEYPPTNGAIPDSSSAPPLVTDCRGPARSIDDNPQTCQESIQVHSDLLCSQIQFVEIAYECIDESVQYNLCQPLTLSGITGDFYLASPSFYSPTTDDVRMPHDATCHCTLTSDPGEFSVRALYLTRRDVWNMTCPTCESRFQKKYEHYPAVNVDLFKAVLQNDSRHVLDVEFQPCCHGSSADNELWIHITGSTNFDLLCNTVASESTSTSPPSTDGIVDSTSSQSTQGSLISSEASPLFFSVTSSASKNPSKPTTEWSTTGNNTANQITTGSGITNQITTGSAITNQDTTDSTTANRNRVNSVIDGVIANQNTPGDITANQNTTDSVTANQNMTSGGTTNASLWIAVTDDTTELDDESPENHVYVIIAAVVGFLLVLIIIIIIIIIVFMIRRRRHQGSNAVLRSRDFSGTAERHAQSADDPARFSTHDYTEVDLSDNTFDGQLPPYLAEDHRLPQNGKGVTGHMDTGVSGNHAQRSGLPEVIHLKTMPCSEDSTRKLPPEGKSEGFPTGDNVYFILEAQPDHEEKRDFLFLVDPQGYNLIEDAQLELRGDGPEESVLCNGPVSEAARAAENSEGNYYSVIKEVDESLSGSHSTEGHCGPRQGKDSRRLYEDVGLQDDGTASPERIIVLGTSRLGPGETALQHSKSDTNDDDDELVMVDNVAYQSADSIVDVNDDGDDDELVMIDNVAYVSADDIVNVNEDGDDEVVMIDNVAYVSADSVPKEIGDTDSTDDDVASDDDFGGNYDDDFIMIDNTSYVSEDTV